MNREEFLEARRAGIGSSDAAPIIGLCPYRTALGVYLDKIGRAEEWREMPAPLEWGIRKEPVIAAAVADKLGWELRKLPIVAHPEYPWIVANVDRINGGGEIVEIKSTARAAGWGTPDTDEIPANYWAQVQHQLAVVESAPLAWVFVLVGQCDFRRYRVARDPDYFGEVFPVYREFWDHVQECVPPAPEWDHPGCLASVQRLYESQKGKTVALGVDAAALASEYAFLGQRASEIEKARESIKARLVAALGDAETGTLDDGRQVKRRQVERKGYAVKPATYWDFRISTPKGDYDRE